eukprot:3395905-Pleurochrysis_carterae.AAC.1
MAVCACKPTHARDRREIRLRACCGGTEERSSAGLATEPSAVKMGGRQDEREASREIQGNSSQFRRGRGQK